MVVGVSRHFTVKSNDPSLGRPSSLETACQLTVHLPAMKGPVGIPVRVLPSAEILLTVFKAMPSPMESANPDKAGAIFSLKVSLMLRGAVTSAFLAGADSTNPAWAKAEDVNITTSANPANAVRM